MLGRGARTAGGVARVLRLASRVTVSGGLGLLRERLGWSAYSVATASAACARGPHHPPGLVDLDAIWNFSFKAESGRSVPKLILRSSALFTHCPNLHCFGHAPRSKGRH